MKRLVLIPAAILIASLGAAPAQAPAPAVVITPVLASQVTAAGQPITLPAGPLEVQVSTYEIPGGTRLAVHRHPYQRYAYVLSGTLRVTDVEAGTSTTYGPGEFVVEMVGRWHYGEAIGEETVRLVVIDQMPVGESNTELAE